jgi:SAM-dependent methyltransferase
MSNTIDSSVKWWMGNVSCPWCGENPSSADSEIPTACSSCHKPFELKDNRLEWFSDGEETKRCDAPTGIMDIIKRALHPLSNPLLPMRYWSVLRLEQYYRRILHDQTFAKKWGNHYFSGLDLPSDATIFDHGCGRGRNLALLNHLGFKVVGQDMTEDKWWKKLPDNGFQVVPPGCPRLPWKDSSFDLVNDMNVISYIPRESFERLIKEIKRVLKPGGYWIVLEANVESFGKKAFQMEHLIPLSLMRSLATQNGFKEIDISYESFYAPVFPLVINFIRKQCGPWPLDKSDYDSWIAKQIQPEKRGMWLLRLRRGE